MSQNISQNQALAHADILPNMTKTKNKRKQGQQMKIGIQAAFLDAFLASGSQSRQMSGGLARLALV